MKHTLEGSKDSYHHEDVVCDYIDFVHMGASAVSERHIHKMDLATRGGR